MGVLYALRFLAAFTSVNRMLTLTQLSSAGAGDNAAAGGARTSLLQLSRKEGILNAVSSILYPAVSETVPVPSNNALFYDQYFIITLKQHLEQCNSWALITQACQKNHLFGTEGASSYGALVGLTVEAASTVLRNVAMVAVVGVTSVSSAPNAGNDGGKEASQAALETLLRSHSISRLVDACRVYGASLSDKCVAQVVNVFQELVLNSSRFFAQVSLSSSLFFFMIVWLIFFALNCSLSKWKD